MLHDLYRSTWYQEKHSGPRLRADNADIQPRPRSMHKCFIYRYVHICMYEMSFKIITWNLPVNCISSVMFKFWLQKIIANRRAVSFYQWIQRQWMKHFSTFRRFVCLKNKHSWPLYRTSQFTLVFYCNIVLKIITCVASNLHF